MSATMRIPVPAQPGRHDHRTAPGPHARIIDLDAERLRRRPRAVYVRRRLAVLTTALLAVLALALGLGAATADAGPATPELAGSAVVAPGQTLWQLAVEHAPAGADPRAYLASIQEVNDLGGGPLPPWTVILLPAN